MKKGIIIILLLIGFSNAIWANEKDKAPVIVKKMSHLGSYYDTKFYNYKGKVYVIQDDNGLKISTYYNGVITELYKKSGALVHGPAAVFGYGGYLWVPANTQESNTQDFYRFNVKTHVMEIITVKVPFSDWAGNVFTASCVLDTSIYIFRWNRDEPIMVDVYTLNTITDTTLVLSESFELGSYEKGNPNVRSAESFLDTDGVLKVAYIVSGDTYKGKIYNTATKKTTQFWSKSNLSDARIAFGSLQWDKQTEAIDAGEGTASNPHRLSIFFVKNKTEKQKGENYSKKYELGFIQFVYGGGNIYGNELPTRLNPSYECSVLFSSPDYYTKKSDFPFIDLAYNYAPRDKSNFIDGNEAHQKQVLFVSMDDSKTMVSYFNSDIYMISPGNESLAFTDFSEDTCQNSKNLWSLIGITDGAPPAPVDWDLWESQHSVIIEPSELEIEYDLSSGINVTKTNETSHSSGFGGSFKFEPYISVSGGYSTKDADVNVSLNELETKITLNISKKLTLNRETQHNGYYIYSAPTISRYEYNLYCWWDESTNKLPLLSPQYTFRTTAERIVIEPRPLDSGIFQIKNPNDYNMAEWRARAEDKPGTITYMAARQGLNPVVYSLTEFGAKATITEETVTTDEVETTHTTSTDWSIGGGINKPHIFSFEVEFEGSDETKFSTKSSTISSIGKSVTLTHEKGTPANGFMSDGYNVDVYLFTPNRAKNTQDWWYFDSLPKGAKPWYIAYAVKPLSQSAFVLKSPAANKQFFSGEALDFKWDGEFSDVELFVLNSQAVRPENIVRRIKTGTSLKAGINGLEPGKYYWALSGKDADGILVYSESSSFEVLPKEFFKPSETSKSYHNTIPVLIYPNPAANNSTHVSYQTQQTGSVHLQLYTVQGQLVWEKSINHQVEGIYNEEIPLNNMGQIGIFVIDTPNGRGVQKILKQ